jgi:hypothetical protein
MTSMRCFEKSHRQLLESEWVCRRNKNRNETNLSDHLQQCLRESRPSLLILVLHLSVSDTRAHDGATHGQFGKNKESDDEEEECDDRVHYEVLRRLAMESPHPVTFQLGTNVAINKLVLQLFEWIEVKLGLLKAKMRVMTNYSLTIRPKLSRLYTKRWNIALGRVFFKILFGLIAFTKDDITNGLLAR